MKKKLILLLVLGLASINFSLFAQQRDARKRAEFDALKEKRVAFITKVVELSAEEAKGFWPLFNELQDKKFELNQQLKKTLYEFRKSEKEGKKHTESEYKEMVDLSVQSKITEAKLDEEYVAKFVKVISYEKIFRYQQAELQFARQLLDQRRDSDSDKQKQ